MPLTFPSSPTVGQQSTQNGRTYQWSGSAWELVVQTATGTAITDASLITTGTLPDARLSSNIVRTTDSRLNEEVVEYLATSNFPATGNSSLLYVATDASRAYRWTGTEYVEVGTSTVFYTAHTHTAQQISDSTTAGRALLTGADAAAQRTSLGLGTMATQASTSYVSKAGDTMTNQLVLPAGSTTAPSFGIAGDTNCGMAQLGGTATLGVVTAGVERWRVGADGATQSVIPGGSTLLPQFMCRAWVNFDGTKDTTGAASTANTNRLIRASGNVTSVLRNALGDYTITFTTAMPDANYAVTGSCASPAVMSGYVSAGGAASSQSASSFRFAAYNNASTVFDPALTSVVFFR